MSSEAHASPPSRSASAVRFTLSWTVGLGIIVSLVLGAGWIWRVDTHPSVEIHDKAGVLKSTGLTRRLENLDFDGVVHIAVLTLKADEDTPKKTTTAVWDYTRTHPTEKTWIYEVANGARRVWAKDLLLYVVIPERDEFVVYPGTSVHLDESAHEEVKRVLSEAIDSGDYADAIVATAQQVHPSIPLPQRSWWQILAPILMGVVALIGTMVAVGSLLVLRDHLNNRAALLCRLEALAEGNEEDLQTIAHSSMTPHDADFLLQRAHRRQGDIAQGLERAIALTVFSIPQMATIYAEETLAELTEHVRSLERPGLDHHYDIVFLAQEDGWKDLWQIEMRSAVDDCRSAQKIAYTRWHPLLSASDNGRLLAAVPTEVSQQCEALGRALEAGDITAVDALEQLRSYDDTLRDWLLRRIPALMRAAGYHVPEFDSDFDDNVLAIEDTYPDEFDEALRENLMRYRLADEVPQPVAGCTVAHYVSVQALAEAIDEWVQRP